MCFISIVTIVCFISTEGSFKLGIADRKLAVAVLFISLTAECFLAITLGVLCRSHTTEDKCQIIK